MPGGVQNILSRGLEGGNRGGTGGVLSAHGWRGPGAKHEESGRSVEEEASNLMGRDQAISDDDVGLMDKNDDILHKQLRGYKAQKVAALLKKGFDMKKLAEPVSHNLFYTLEWLMGDDEGAWPDGGREFLDQFTDQADQHDKYQKDGDVPRAGILKDPEGFKGKGWSEAGPTSVGEAPNLHNNGPDAGADDMANYRDEQAAKEVQREMKVKKKMAMLLKQAMLPPAGSMKEETPVPQDEDPDVKRKCPSSPQISVYQPTTRTTNKPVTSNVIKAAAESSSTSALTPMPSNNPTQDFSKRMSNSLKNYVGKQVKAKSTKPIADVRDETTSSPNKVPKGYPELDKKVPDSPSGSTAKMAALLKLCFV